MTSSQFAARLPDAEGLARFLGVGRETVDQLRRDGRIPFLRIGPKTIRFEPDRVIEALRADRGREDERQDGAA